ncbi:MAG: TIGR04083 family peptide-modifying radical SAM enzyme [Candidatus Limnocylindrales bacterium]
MLVPSLSCPAGCAYRFGPHVGAEVMSRAMIDAVVRWQRALHEDRDGGEDALEVTFHGGEPLVPGAAFYRMALPALRDGLAPQRVRFAIQSNLWLLTDELCELFARYRVSLGTSLDGPEAINDAQRGAGYHARTMAGIELARAHGLSPSAICTFTAQSAPAADEVFDFFLGKGLNFSLHAALPSLRNPAVKRWALPPAVHGELLVHLLDRYLDNLTRIRISTLDSMARSVSAGQGGICTFGDCLGRYLAVGPDGAIYPCQRFAGLAHYRIGNVADCPSVEDMAGTPVWTAFAARQAQIAQDCGDCSALGICRGGCPYNALVGNDLNGRDPHCAAYKRAFEHISERALSEVFAPGNLDAIIERPDRERGLMRQGRLLSLMRDGPHPYETAGHARRILAAVALASTDSPGAAAQRFAVLGLASDVTRTTRSMTAMFAGLTAPASGRNNVYLHVTFACNLRCTHCYASAGTPGRGVLAVPGLVRACREAAAEGFRQAVITGGEPLVHPDRDAMLDALAAMRSGVKPMLTVLRTSLALLLDEALLLRLSRSTDQVVVSLDGNRETHDERRGEGTYDLVLANLRALVALGGEAEISLATVLPLGQANGPAGDSVRALGKELGIRRVRFRPLLPLGRAGDSMPQVVPETLWGHLDLADMMNDGFTPTATCGIGQNLYVEPDGSAYPCYAWCSPETRLGSIAPADGLATLLDSDAFRAVGGHTVNTNRACRTCPLRYLCGGACRAWNRGADDGATDLDAPPAKCGALHARARSLLAGALDHLGIPEAQWRAAGLPLPESPPAILERAEGA